MAQLMPVVLSVRPGVKGWQPRWPTEQDSIDRACHTLGPIFLTACPLDGTAMHGDMLPGIAGESLPSIWCCHACMTKYNIYYGFYSAKLPSTWYDTVRQCAKAQNEVNSNGPDSNTTPLPGGA